ncbi:MAG: sigma-70 family RNA polymerase sigma factor [Selenomonadaceae bacterium]|nr:sigma-70 family RNA polymerase sigma factor [Selenomonadaceae bacterium]
MVEFQNIYSQYYRKIYNYVYMQLLHREIAEDVTSDVFFAVWKNLENFDPERGNISSWLFAIAHNAVKDYRKKAYFRHETSVWETPETPSQDFLRQDGEEGTLKNPTNRRAYRILKKLTQDERHLLSLRYELDMTHEKIAHILGMNASAVRQKYSRLLAKCRKIDEQQEIF